MHKLRCVASRVPGHTVNHNGRWIAPLFGIHTGWLRRGLDRGAKGTDQFQKAHIYPVLFKPVHAVASNGKFVRVELLNAARGNPHSFHHAKATNHGVKKETVSPG